MARSMARWVALAGGIAALALGGCSSSGTSGSQGSAATGSEFDQGAGPDSGPTMSSTSELGTVYFDYDQSSIRSDARGTLQGNASAIKSSDWASITIEGHTDERGTEEYNLALGERRANAVRIYLIDLGVPSSKLRTVSFGEAKPAVMGHDESAWRYNRRGEFKVSSR